MSKAEMEQINYELEMIRIEFMDKISEIAGEVWELQRPTWQQHYSNSPGNLEIMEDIAPNFIIKF